MNVLMLHERSANTIYAFGPDYRLLYFNPAYSRFAAENGSPEVARRWGVGSSVLDCIPGPMKERFRRLYDQAFAGQIVEHEYTCHSPELHRRFLLRLVHEPGGRVIAEHSLIVQHPHRDITDLDSPERASEYMHDSGLIIQCCNCNKVRSTVDPGRWDLVRSYLGAPPSQVSHGLCSVCLAQLYPEVGLPATEDLSDPRHQALAFSPASG